MKIAASAMAPIANAQAPGQVHGRKSDEPGTRAMAKPLAALSSDVGGATGAEAEFAVPANEDKGVIRNLLSGHYQGVADVRLRINFADEIKALEEQARQAALRDAAAAFGSKLEDALAGLASAETADDAQAGALASAQGDFRAAVDAAFVNPSSNDALVASLQSALDDFVATLQSVMEPTPEEQPPTEEIQDRTPALEAAATTSSDPTAEVAPITVEPTPTESSFELAGFIAGLEAAFAAQLTELTGQLQSVQVLPALSEPHGNGQAYDKFVKVYSEIYAVSDPRENAGPGIDTEA